MASKNGPLNPLTIFLSYLFFTTVSSKQLTDDSKNYAAINRYLQGLSFNRDEVLTFRSAGTSSFIPKEGRHDEDSNFIVITRELKNVYEGKGSIGVVTANVHRTYPGSLLLANSRFIDNQPDVVVIGRKPMLYTVDLPGLTKSDGSFKAIPSYADYQASLNKVLYKWFENHSKDQIVANFESEYAFAKDEDQLRVKLGTDLKFTNIEANVDFESARNNDKIIMLTKFKQIFYTVSVPSSRYPADLFDSTVKPSEVESKMTERDPPVIVDSVSYGRMIYALIETTSTNSTAKAILETNFSGYGELSSDVDYSKVLDNFSIKIFVMGGGTQHVELINAKTPKDINDVLVKLRNFNRTNPGFPLSYSSEFVNDNSRAMIQGYAEYVETRRDLLEHGNLVLEQKGAFIAQFLVHWREFSFDKDGRETYVSKQWEKNGKNLTSYWTTRIQLPGNVRYLSITAMGCTGLFWEWWRTTVDFKNIPMVPYRKILIWGTTLNQHAEVSPAYSE